MQNELSTNVSQFRNSVKEAIDVRERALYPKNALCELPFDVQTEEIIRKEQILLMSVLEQFNSLFGGIECSE
jgi:hypothetical protein